jgi:hypothetical protein
MRRLLIALALACSAPLASCGPTNVNSVSAQVVISADAIYTAASIAGGDLVALGKLDQARYRQLDNQAYAILLQIRAGKATIDQLRAVTTLMTTGS